MQTFTGDVHKKELDPQKIDRAQECLDKGLVLAMFGDDDSALRFYRKALLLDPASALAHYMLGVALIKLGATSDALGEWRAATKSDQPGSRSDWAKRQAAELLRDHGGD
jgi:tetratricopeptide (TPR) repeat protein